jgi:hypothetical protein
MKTIITLVLFAFLPTLALGLNERQVQGAWMEDGTRWIKAPPDVNSHLETSEAEILYFGQDHTFVIIHCFVNRVPNQYETISHGDGQVVYRGRWNATGDNIDVEYRLVSRTAQIKGETLPGPIQRATIKTPHKILTFERKNFHRTPGLDKSAVEVLNGAPS